MSKSTDKQGRIYLPKDVRDQFGEEYRIAELPTYVALFPVDDDPLEGARDAVGDAFQDRPVDELKDDAQASIGREVADE